MAAKLDVRALLEARDYARLRGEFRSRFAIRQEVLPMVRAKLGEIGEWREKGLRSNWACKGLMSRYG